MSFLHSVEPSGVVIAASEQSDGGLAFSHTLLLESKLSALQPKSNLSNADLRVSTYATYQINAQFISKEQWKLHYFFNLHVRYDM